MAEDIRLSERGLRVLRFLIEQPTARRSGADIAKATGVGSGTLYPLLARLETAGWLKGEWEKVEPSEVGRPRRRLYRLTGLGQRRGREALSGLQIGAVAWAT
jgi:PadR family transcriptional regulator, regulatory protein PadR